VSPVGRALFEAKLEQSDRRSYVTVAHAETGEVFFKEQVENNPEAISKKFEELLQRTKLLAQGLGKVSDTEAIWQQFLLSQGLNAELANLWAGRLPYGFMAILDPTGNIEVVSSPQDLAKLSSPFVALSFVENLTNAKSWLARLGIFEISKDMSFEFYFDDGSNIRFIQSNGKLIVNLIKSKLSDPLNSEACRLIGATFPIPKNKKFELFEHNGIKVIKPASLDRDLNEIKRIVETTQKVAGHFEQDFGTKIVEEIVVGGESAPNQAFKNGKTISLNHEVVSAILANEKGMELILAHEISHLAEYRVRGHA